MDPSQLQVALWDPVPLGGLLDELVKDWHCHRSEAIDEIIPQCLLHPYAKAAPWHMQELWRMKQELKWLEPV